MNIEDEIKVKAAELEALLNKAHPGTSAYIETHNVSRLGDKDERRVFAIRIEFTRRIYPHD